MGASSGVSSTPSAANLPAPSRDSARALVDHFAAAAERERIPTIAWALSTDGALVAGEGVDLQARICSMTKSFIAVAVLQLRDADALRLDDPAAAYVPAVDAWRHPVTLRQLLTMTAGLPVDDWWADRCLDWPHERLEALLRGGVTFARPPGRRFEYANLGWAVLGLVVTRVAGVRVQDYVAERLLQPLGLTRTGWTPLEPTLRGHRRVRGEIVPEREPLGDGAFSPIGGLWSTARDICRWMAFLSDGDERVLSQESRTEMQTMHAVAFADERVVRGYGYGLFVEEDERLGGVVQHPGGLPGFGSSMRWLPEHRVGVVALANLTYARMSDATRDALDLVVASERHRVAAQLALRLAAQLAAWDPAAEAALFSDNVLLDVAREERIEQARALTPFTVGEVDALSETQAVLPLHTAAGERRLRVWLTPEREPRVQHYEVQA